MTAAKDQGSPSLGLGEVERIARQIVAKSEKGEHDPLPHYLACKLADAALSLLRDREGECGAGAAAFDAGHTAPAASAWRSTIVAALHGARSCLQGLASPGPGIKPALLEIDAALALLHVPKQETVSDERDGAVAERSAARSEHPVMMTASDLGCYEKTCQQGKGDPPMDCIWPDCPCGVYFQEARSEHKWTCIVDGGPPCPGVCVRQGFCTWLPPRSEHPSSDRGREDSPLDARTLEAAAKIVQGRNDGRYRYWKFWPEGNRSNEDVIVTFADDAAKAIRSLTQEGGR